MRQMWKRSGSRYVFPTIYNMKQYLSPFCTVGVSLWFVCFRRRCCIIDHPCIDVGGGSVSNKTRYSLARIPLRWMIRECFKANTGIMFNRKGLRELGLDPSALYPFVTPRPPPTPIGDATIKELPHKPSWTRRCFSGFKKTLSPYSVPHIAEAPINETKADKTPVGTEEEEDLNDALSPICDQLKLQRAWWILEVLPLKLRYQLEDNNWVSYTRCVSPT
jgi:hypothetical protein